MGAFTRLRESGFSVTEKRIADYILKNADRLPDLTISTVAAECGTSKSMVVQLCKTAGFKGYKDLCGQLLVEQALRQQQDPEPDYDDLHPGCTTAQLCQLTFREELRSLQATAELTDPTAIEQAATLLLQADRIALFGVGSSAMAAMDLYYKLCRVGLNVRFSQDVHCQLLDTASMTEQSAAVVFSFNGRTRDMIEACELAKGQGAHLISITRYGTNPIASMSDVALYVASNESLRRVTTMSSRLCTLAVSDVLFSCLVNRMGPQVNDLIQRNTMIANRRRK